MPTKTNKIIELHNSGLSGYKIAEATGISQTQVRRILIENGLKGHSIRTPLETELKIIEIYKSGVSSEKIAEDFGMNGTTVCRILKRHKIPIRDAFENKVRIKLDEHAFDVIDTEEKAYFLGLFLTDGNVSTKQNEFKLELWPQDRHILESLAKLIFENPEGQIHTDKKRKDGREYLYVSVTRKHIKDTLVKHGCVPRKTFFTRFPFHVDPAFYPHVIRGLWDGDGGVYNYDWESPRVSFNGTIEIINDIISIIKMHAYIGRRYKDRDNNIRSMEIKKQADVKRFLKMIYENSTIALTRKKKTSDEALEKLKHVVGDDELKEMYSRMSVNEIATTIKSKKKTVIKRLTSLGLI